MRKSAEISECGKYRYALERQWGRNPAMIWIMLNPSTADADLDDPTIRRCMSFAKEQACGGIYVINLFALRATDPKELKEAEDPIGPKNDYEIYNALYLARKFDYPVMCGWGAHELAVKRSRTVQEACIRYEGKLRCYGKTKSGAPKHPLYLPSNSKVIDWNGY